ncbi:MAG: T9SS type A sorting domain-containing protein [Bacteroidetes bacterium]|nr:T9SS type A sorting domain-containing protein [Bacteroidota bacterium]
MKKILLIAVALLMVAATVNSQTVQRNKVVCEISTGTWCTYCPGAANAATNLIASGANVAVIEYHNGDVFANAASNARNSYYAITGYPTAHFDGPTAQVGGSACPGNGVSYTNNYNNCYAVQSPVVLDIAGTNSGNDYTVVLSIHKGATVSGSDVRAHLVLTETDISAAAWPPGYGCMTTVHHVERLMVPDYNGTAINFSSGDMQIIVLTFTKDPAWVLANCALVAFVQDYSTKTIYNGATVALNSLPAPVTVNFASNVTSGCAPFTVNYTDQSAGVNTYQWDLPGATPPTSTSQNPSVSYTATGTYNATLTAWSSTTFRGNKVVKTNYITALAFPDIAGTPSGSNNLCSNPANQTYNCAPANNATSYVWDLSPASAGVITNNGTSCTIDFDNVYVGSCNLKVKGTNSCGDGPWSPTLSITLNQQPGTPGAPTGSAMLCLNPANTDYTTSGTTPATSYIWEIVPSSAGTISGSSLIGTVDWSASFVGAATIHVKASNLGCEGPWSPDMLVNVNSGPASYTMTGGGTTCATGSGIAVGLDGSQTGINYTLYLNASPTSNIVAGTGGAITFGNQTVAGNYSSWGTNIATTCSGVMNGVSAVSIDPQVPDAPAQPAGNSNPAAGTTTDYTTAGGTYATTYNWVVTPASAGTFSGTGTTVSITWSLSYAGSASIKVQGVNSCGAGAFSQEFPVNVVTGITEHQSQKFISVYPNPASGTVNIIPQYKMKADLRVMNALGSVVIEKTGLELNGTYPLDITSLTRGVYFFNFTSSEKQLVLKVIVE